MGVCKILSVSIPVLFLPRIAGYFPVVPVLATPNGTSLFEQLRLEHSLILGTGPFPCCFSNTTQEAVLVLSALMLRRVDQSSRIDVVSTQEQAADSRHDNEHRDSLSVAAQPVLPIERPEGDCVLHSNV